MCLIWTIINIIVFLYWHTFTRTKEAHQKMHHLPQKRNWVGNLKIMGWQLLTIIKVSTHYHYVADRMQNMILLVVPNAIVLFTPPWTNDTATSKHTFNVYVFLLYILCLCAETASKLKMYERWKWRIHYGGHYNFPITYYRFHQIFIKASESKSHSYIAH